MKKQVFFSIGVLLNLTMFAQNSFPTPSGNVAIGVTTPLALLHVYNPTQLASSPGSIAEVVRIGSGVTNNLQMRFQTYRYATGTGWSNSASYKMQFVVDVSSKAYIEFAPQGAGDGMAFGNVWGEVARITSNNSGNFLIGKTTQANTNYKLDVGGNVRADKLNVNSDGADFVFDSSYNLPTLDEVEDYIKQHQHLPQIASASEMQKDGIDVGEAQTKLLQKIEELTLYLIEQNKEIIELKKQLQILANNKN